MWRGSSQRYRSTPGTKSNCRVLAPRHHVPGQRFVGRAAFRFEGQRMSDFIRGYRERQRHAILRIAVDSIGIDLLHQFGDRMRPRHSRIARSLVPHHHRKQHAHAAAMEVRDHLPHARDAARHAANHVVLIAIVDAHVGIGGPDQYGVDAAIALFQIIQIAVDRIFARRPDRRNSDPAPSSAAA